MGVIYVKIRNINNAHYERRLEKALWNTKSKWHTIQEWLSQVKYVPHSLARNFPYKHLHMYTRRSILAKVFLLNLYQSTWFTFMWFTFTSQQGNGYNDFLGWSSGRDKHWVLEIRMKLTERACRYTPKLPWLRKWVMSVFAGVLVTSALPHNSYLYGISLLW